MDKWKSKNCLNFPTYPFFPINLFAMGARQRDENHEVTVNLTKTIPLQVNFPEKLNWSGLP